MFSQFRQAVEQLVPVAAHNGDNTNNSERRSSLDVPALRRSISQRPGETRTASPGPIQRSQTTSPPTAVRKSNLEERLRRVTHAAIESPSPSSSSSLNSASASASASATSSATTKDTTGSPAAPLDSAKKSQETTPAAAQSGVLSPASTPLPPSPASQSTGDPPTSSASESRRPDTPDLELDSVKEKVAKEGNKLVGKADSADTSQEAMEKEEVVAADNSKSSHPLSNVTEGEAASGISGANTLEKGQVVEGANKDDALASGDNTASDEAQTDGGVLGQGNVNDLPEQLAVEPLPIESKADSVPEPQDRTVNSDSPSGSPSVAHGKEHTDNPLEDSAVVESNLNEEANDTGLSSSAPSTSDSTESNSASNEDVTVPPVAPKINATSVGVEELQRRLKQVEQRFADVSTSFKRLQAEKVAADTVLKELTPIDTIRDSSGLQDYLKNLNVKQEIFQSEVKLLNGKLSSYEGRLEELRDVHRLESKSQTDQIDKLRTQLQETEALFQASEKAMSAVESKLESGSSDTKKLQDELERYKTIATQEEEKRVKAVSLLKTVRQKLVRTEKEKEDALREVAASKERDRGEKEKDHAGKLKLQQDLEMMQIEKEKAVATQKAQFEREMGAVKERYEKELAAVKGQLELEIITLKSTHAKELAVKSSKISALENSLNGVARDKNVFFEQLQIKQAETESAQSHLESLQHQNTELEYQLREANDRLALIKEEYADYQREQESKAREPVTSASDIAHMISATESKYEVKLMEMKRSVGVLEKERSESEANWSRKLKEKVRELEELKQLLGSAAKSREQDINVGEQLKADLGRAREEVRILKEQLLDVPALHEQIQDLKRMLKEKDEDIRIKTLALEQHEEEHKSRESQLKQANKTLREELRKVQSSAALLERQRNPGVGYWNRVGDAEGVPQSPAMSTTSEISLPSEASPRPNSPAVAATNQEEEVNLEYLRNVILQFLEHKDMRPSLVKVISIILHFTPQETRRLMAKV